MKLAESYLSRFEEARKMASDSDKKKFKSLNDQIQKLEDQRAKVRDELLKKVGDGSKELSQSEYDKLQNESQSLKDKISKLEDEKRKMHNKFHSLRAKPMLDEELNPVEGSTMKSAVIAAKIDRKPVAKQAEMYKASLQILLDIVAQIPSAKMHLKNWENAVMSQVIKGDMHDEENMVDIPDGEENLELFQEGIGPKEQAQEKLDKFKELVKKTKEEISKADGQKKKNLETKLSRLQTSVKSMQKIIKELK
jgi:predicted  nucleic acid-binding Zn-ribbon protein